VTSYSRGSSSRAEQNNPRSIVPAGRIRRPLDVLQYLPRHAWQLGNVHRDQERCKSSGPMRLIVLCRFPGPALYLSASPSKKSMISITWIPIAIAVRGIQRQAFKAQKAEFLVHDPTGESACPTPCHLMPPREEVAHALIDSWTRNRSGR
jgi:hypothetical protein